MKGRGDALAVLHLHPLLSRSPPLAPSSSGWLWVAATARPVPSLWWCGVDEHEKLPQSAAWSCLNPSGTAGEDPKEEKKRTEGCEPVSQQGRMDIWGKDVVFKSYVASKLLFEEP